MAAQPSHRARQSAARSSRSGVPRERLSPTRSSPKEGRGAGKGEEVSSLRQNVPAFPACWILDAVSVSRVGCLLTSPHSSTSNIITTSTPPIADDMGGQTSIEPSSSKWLAVAATCAGTLHRRKVHGRWLCGTSIASHFACTAAAGLRSPIILDLISKQSSANSSLHEV